MLNFLKIIPAKRPTSPDKPPVSVREWVSALRHLAALPRLTWHTSPVLANGPWGPECSPYSGAAIGPE